LLELRSGLLHLQQEFSIEFISGSKIFIITFEIKILISDYFFYFLLLKNSSIHYDIKESDIVALFSSFGKITKSEMSMDSSTGRSKGFCFLEYADIASADAAQAMNGFELAGRKVT